jgi:hypothetical protein
MTIFLLGLLGLSCGKRLPKPQDDQPQEESPVFLTDNKPRYVWERLSEHAAFPTSYNYPVHVARDGRFVALHPQGTWTSTDGVTWSRGSLPFSGLNSAYLSYVQHEGATWALGSHTGDYLRFSIHPIVKRTADYRTWTTVGRSTSLPKRVFYAAASFRGRLWMLGGYDGARETSEVWRSTDGLTWELAVRAAPWGPRMSSKAVVFRDRLFLLGGGKLDGPNANDVWSSANGVDWERETTAIAPEEPVGYSPVVYDGHLWLVGANRSGRFTSEMLVSADGKWWRAVSAPWSARGGVAVWTDGRSLFLTGGKSSRVEHGETIFTYNNDVWRMHAASPLAGRSPSLGRWASVKRAVTCLASRSSVCPKFGKSRLRIRRRNALRTYDS